MHKRNAFLVLLLTLIGINWACAFNINNAGDPSVAYLNSFQAKLEGQALKEKFEHENCVLDDPFVNAFLNSLGKILITHSPSPKGPIHFFAVKSFNLNAFTGAGGYVGIDTGIILFVNNESQLAAVMAHETGHVVEAHVSRTLADEREWLQPTLAASLSSVAIAFINPAIGLVGLTSSVSRYQQHLLNFTRQQERTADRIGMEILSKSGFNPAAMPALFNKLMRASEFYPSVPNFLRNHPTDCYRIADSLNRIRSYPVKKYKVHSYFYLIQARVRVEMSRDDAEALLIFKHQINSSKSYERIAGLYGESLLLLKHDDLIKARIILRKLIQKQPKQLLFQIAEINLFLQQHDYQHAYQMAKNLHKQYPKNYPIQFIYAYVAFETQNYQSAKSIFENIVYMHPDNLSAYVYLAQTYQQLGYIQTAMLIHAKLLLKIGNFDAAQAVLKKALLLKGKNPYAKLQIIALLQ